MGAIVAGSPAEPIPTDAGRDRPDAGAPRNEAADEVASIFREGFDIWMAQASRWSERSTERRTWSPEDVVGDSTNLIENLTPLAERSIELTIELLRPLARTLESRR
jgi:hypothetical protein